MKVAIIGASTMAVAFGKQAKANGIETHCFAWEKGAVAKPFMDYFYPVDIFDEDTIERKCRELGIEGIPLTTDLTYPVANRIAVKLGLPHNPEETIRRISDKHWVRERLRDAKIIRQPATVFLAKEDRVPEDLRYPVIVKPTSEGGKNGITVVPDAAGLDAAVAEARESDSKGTGILIEQYLDRGQEYSVEGLSFRGEYQVIQITEKISSGPPHCVELGHSQPAELDSAVKHRVRDAVAEALALTGFENGATHVEIKVIDGEVWLIEINARPGGDHIAWPLVMLSSGYDYIGEIMKVSMGIRPAVRDPELRGEYYAGVRFITKQTAGLADVFDRCDGEPWLYEKHRETEELVELKHNNGGHTNYFIYRSKEKPEF